MLNLAGEVEMGASIMDGTDLNAGAVALVQDVANPISVARRVMERTPHVLLAAHGAVCLPVNRASPPCHLPV